MPIKMLYCDTLSASEIEPEVQKIWTLLGNPESRLADAVRVQGMNPNELAAIRCPILRDVDLRTGKVKSIDVTVDLENTTDNGKMIQHFWSHIVVPWLELRKLYGAFSDLPQGFKPRVTLTSPENSSKKIMKGKRGKTAAANRRRR